MDDQHDAPEELEVQAGMDPALRTAIACYLVAAALATAGVGLLAPVGAAVLVAAAFALAAAAWFLRAATSRAGIVVEVEAPTAIAPVGRPPRADNPRAA